VNKQRESENTPNENTTHLTHRSPPPRLLATDAAALRSGHWAILLSFHPNPPPIVTAWDGAVAAIVITSPRLTREAESHLQWQVCQQVGR